MLPNLHILTPSFVSVLQLLKLFLEHRSPTHLSAARVEAEAPGGFQGRERKLFSGSCRTQLQVTSLRPQQGHC